MWSGVPVINGGFPVHSVSCTSFAFCVAVGGWSYGGTDGIAFDGHSWSSPQELDPVKGFSSVSCASTTYCVAVGGAGAYLFDGQQWTELSAIIGLDGSLTSVSCVSDSFCIAIGNVEGSSDTSTAYVLDNTENCLAPFEPDRCPGRRLGAGYQPWLTAHRYVRIYGKIGLG